MFFVWLYWNIVHYKIKVAALRKFLKFNNLEFWICYSALEWHYCCISALATVTIIMTQPLPKLLWAVLITLTCDLTLEWTSVKFHWGSTKCQSVHDNHAMQLSLTAIKQCLLQALLAEIPPKNVSPIRLAVQIMTHSLHYKIPFQYPSVNVSRICIFLTVSQH